uniref:tRNA-specific adenosine deaminase 1 n=1 Tax=Clastoptera arizonana TaxID=38151 RepID=A0A1B6DCN8_9HEMI
MNIADQVAQLCFDHYGNLGKRGKPLPGVEWTLLAAVVQSINESFTVVSMATGTKCIGRNIMSPKGDLINDSHAEVLARRCFLRYLYDKIKTMKDSGHSDIFKGTSNGKFSLKPNVNFILFTSHVPCGDASIIPKTVESCKRKSEFDETNVHKSKKLHVSFEKKRISSDNEPKKNDTNLNQSVDLESINKVKDSIDSVGEVLDIYRTGAKCFGKSQDSKLPGLEYHTVGVVRTKPGRGDPTLSVSCSDKIARWIDIGLQGAFLSLLIDERVRPKYLIVSKGGPFSYNTLHRAVISRTGTTNPPKILQSTLVFDDSRYKAPLNAKPCPTSIMWSKVSHKPLEIGVEGRRQGVTKKSRDNGRLMICKLELFRVFISLTGEKYQNMSYREVKNLAKEYQNKWQLLKEKFGGWTEKPQNLSEFKLSDE